MRRFVLLGLGYLFVALGLVGVALPVLPTTPFMLCAAGCFGASDPTRLQRLDGNRFFGEYVRHYRHRTGVTKKTRRRALFFLWGSLTVSALLAQTTGLRLLLLAVGLAVSVHLLLIKTAE